jgi:hypothetical protein
LVRQIGQLPGPDPPPLMARFNIILNLVLISTASASLCHAQDPVPAVENSPVEIQFQDANLKLFSGVVNDVSVNLMFLSGKHPRVKFHAIAKGATLRYNEEGLVKILPTAPEVRLRVYAEIKDKLYWAGDVPFKCIPPPSPGEYGSAGLKKTLDPMNFVITGKDVVKADDIFVDVFGGPLSELISNQENRVALSVTQKYGEYYRRLLEDYSVQSDDAEVKKISRLIFTIKPNPGVKSCKLTVSLEGEKVGQITLRVDGK